MLVPFLNAIVTVTFLAACAQAQAGMQEGVDAVKNGNYAMAEREFSRLADNGDATAQYRLGLMYDYGHGVPQDDRLALTWYRKAAIQGHAEAQFRVGAMYDTGQGTARNYKAALSWYRKAAQQGNTDAQNNLGVMHSTGQGVRKNLVQAHMWFSLAALAGNEVAIRNKEAVEEKMSPRQIELARELARNRTEKRQ